MPRRNGNPGETPPALTAARAVLAAEIGAPDMLLDWEAVAAVAHTERLAAWLYALGRERHATASGHRALQPAWLAFRRQHLLGVRELGVLLDAFEKAAIPAIPLKGPALAEAIYRDPAGRAFTDLDILVPRDTVDDAIAVLVGLGYRHLVHERTLAYERAHAGAACFAPEDRERSSLPVDLHWSPVCFPGGLVPRGLTDCDVWQRAVLVERLGRRLLQLHDDDLLLYLALHLAVHHPLTGLRWRVELGVFVGRHARDVAWPELVARARAWGVSGAVYFALKAVDASLGVRVPAQAMRSLRPRGVRGAVLDRLAGLTTDRPSLDSVVNMLTLDAAADRLRMLGHAVAPSPAWVRARYDRGSALRGWRDHYARVLGVVARR